MWDVSHVMHENVRNLIHIYFMQRNWIQVLHSTKNWKCRGHCVYIAQQLSASYYCQQCCTLGVTLDCNLTLSYVPSQLTLAFSYYPLYCTLYSANQLVLLQPQVSTEFAKRTFSYLAHKIWHDLPLDIWLSSTLPTFKHRHKTTFTLAVYTPLLSRDQNQDHHWQDQDHQLKSKISC